MYKAGQLSAILVFFLTISSAANAYLDPGTGSMLLQGIIASIALGLFTIKTWWYRLVSFFPNRQQNQKAEEDATIPPEK
ncbi:MAG: hypothetical protein DRR42_27600 [Gammaproteobacteria bacterium]|nr:MAG: hypothetical protein DRR42_27600 [Gammaproteobacteria bacterium]